MCLAQGPQCSDADEAQTRRPLVSSQALHYWTTALLSGLVKDTTPSGIQTLERLIMSPTPNQATVQHTTVM